MEEFQLQLPSMDLKVAGFRCGKRTGPQLLAMHGWLDNAASFTALAPYLSSYDLYAIDFPGHGRSSHFPKSQAYQMFDYVRFGVTFIKQMEWESVYLLGHSLGASIALLTSAMLPELVRGLCLIESFGPITKVQQECANHFQKYIEQSLKKDKTMLSLYSSVSQAAKVRAAYSNVNQDCAEILARRGTVQKDGYYTWSSDPRLRLSSPQPLTEEQLESFLQRVRTQIHLIVAHDGWVFDENLVDKRASQIKNISRTHLPGSHHLHMENPKEVAKVIDKSNIFPLSDS
ncbi:MAG: alpha/beta hydrolase [Oligoflexales bacterium]|nr:alpha/beta hydrolase [Oligoflexales bacterium]